MPSRLFPSPSRRPAAPRRDGARPPSETETGVALRLAIGREGIGLELARPARLGCLSVTDLSATLPGISFPVDVSGGVPRFRHRRGDLQRLEVELASRALERWAAPRLRGLVGTRTPEVWVAVRRAGATACVSASPDPEAEAPAPAPILAFELHALSEGDDLTLVIEQARGAHLPRPALTLAIACVESLLGGAAERQGCVFFLRSAAASVVRSLLPEAGARVPSAEGVRWASLAAAGDSWVLQAARGAVTAQPSEDAIRAREAAVLLREADDALVRGEEEDARALCMDALERAPRHPEVVRRIADLDVRAGGREEAALAMLVEARTGQAGADARFGTLPGELLLKTGATRAALASLERAGDTEPAPALAARAYETAAGEASDPEQAAYWLDRSLARSARSISARWLRVGRRLQLGRLEDALADAELLEAQARGTAAKHMVWLRAGRAWRAAGLSAQAGPVYERALRFVPDEPRALAGLGAALVGEGRVARGVSVLERALEVAEGRREATASILLELGRALADGLDDLPAAVARASSIPPEAAEALEARALEGRWRARLGDLAGAALAFARLRELASSMASGGDEVTTGATSEWLREAADFERTRLGDLLAAQRHLAVAVRLRPHDSELLRSYREVGALVAREARGPAASAVLRDGPDAREVRRAPEDAPDEPLAPDELPMRAALSGLDLSPAEDADAEQAARIEQLTQRLQGNPADDEVADELATLLERAGRGHELLALLSARLEDATPERRAVLAPRAGAALRRLAADAEAAGRREEGALYRDAAAALSS